MKREIQSSFKTSLLKRFKPNTKYSEKETINHIFNKLKESKLFLLTEIGLEMKIKIKKSKTFLREKKIIMMKVLCLGICSQ